MFRGVAQAQAIVLMLLAVGCFIVELWAFVDALRHPNSAYVAAGKRTKTFWLILTGIAAGVGFMTVPYPIGMGRGGFGGIIGIASLVAAAVYLADVRPAVRSHGRGTRPPRRTSNGGW